MNRELLQFLPVPPHLGTVLSPDAWTRLEAEISSPLPADLKEFNETYGAGSLGRDILLPLLPTTDGIYSQLESNDRARLLLMEYRLDGFVPADLKIFPEPGGLLQWADSGDGHMWFWLTVGDPDSWTVVAVPHDCEDSIYYYDCNATSYILRLLRGDFDDDVSRSLLASPEVPSLNSFQFVELRA